MLNIEKHHREDSNVKEEIRWNFVRVEFLIDQNEFLNIDFPSKDETR